MNESLNSSTTLLPLLSIDPKNSLYVNASILAFSIIATTNHIMPENFEGLTHGVKMLYSNILFSLLNLNPGIGLMISLIDLLPILSKNKILMGFGEKILQIPRKLIEIYFIYQIFAWDKYEIYLILICKIIYFYERRERIISGKRNDFPALHSAEHIGLYFFIKELTQTEFSFKLYLIYLLLFILLLAFFVISVNNYIYFNLDRRTPYWVKENPLLVSILGEKIENNRNSFKIHNYIFKPWLSHLKIQFITWNRIEEIVNDMSKNIKIDEFDMVVGISTGGAFVGAYLAKVINKPFEVIHSKLWSGMSFPENIVRISMWFLGREVSPKISNCPNVKGKRILLVDDTTYTGITLKKNMKCLMINGAESVKTLCLFIHKINGADHYYEKDHRVPIIWEWGCEID